MTDLPKREIIARRIARELKDGFTVNLGIGMPTLCANYIPPGSRSCCTPRTACSVSGRILSKAKKIPILINAGKETVTALPGASYFSSADSFAMIRGGHIDLTGAWGDGSGRARQSGQLDDPRENGQRHGRRHGSGRRRETRHRRDGARDQRTASRKS